MERARLVSRGVGSIESTRQGRPSSLLASSARSSNNGPFPRVSNLNQDTLLPLRSLHRRAGGGLGLGRRPCPAASSRTIVPRRHRSTAQEQGEEDQAFQQAILRFLDAARDHHMLPPLAIAPSTIPGAGRGLFLRAPTGGGGGMLLPKGTILTLYPGLTYQLPLDLEPLQHVDEAMAGPPDFMLGNGYLLRVGLASTVQRKGRAARVIHDYLVDAQPWGLSAQLFREVVARRQALPNHAWGGVNDAWLEEEGEEEDKSGGKKEEEEEWAAKRACALGGIINDPQGSAAGKPNVEFKAARLCLKDAGARDLLPWIPTLPASAARDREGERVVVAAVAAEALEVKDRDGPLELFVSYGQDPRSVGVV